MQGARFEVQPAAQLRVSGGEPGGVHGPRSIMGTPRKDDPDTLSSGSRQPCGSGRALVKCAGVRVLGPQARRQRHGLGVCRCACAGARRQRLGYRMPLDHLHVCVTVHAASLSGPHSAVVTSASGLANGGQHTSATLVSSVSW